MISILKINVFKPIGLVAVQKMKPLTGTYQVIFKDFLKFSNAGDVKLLIPSLMTCAALLRPVPTGTQNAGSGRQRYL